MGDKEAPMPCFLRGSGQSSVLVACCGQLCPPPAPGLPQKGASLSTPTLQDPRARSVSLPPELQTRDPDPAEAGGS